MALQGQIKEFGLSEIFQLIQIQKREGVLTLRQGKTVATVLFEAGAVVLAKPGPEDEWIGIANLLIKGKRITADQLSTATSKIKTDGTSEVVPYMVEKGFLKKEEARAAIRLYIQEVLFSLFTWRSGDYEFEARTISYNRDYFSPINMEGVLMDVMQRMDEWPRLRKRIPVRGRIYEKTEKDVTQAGGKKAEENGKEDEFSLDGLDISPESDEEGAGLAGEKRVVYDLLGNGRSVTTLVELSMLGEYTVYKALYDLEDEGYIRPSAALSAETAKSETVKGGHQAPVQKKALLISGVINSLILLVLIGTAVVSLPAVNLSDPLSAEVLRPFQELTIGEQMDRIQYALRLYYLRHQHFPETLDSLVRDGDLAPKDVLDPLGQPWAYSAGSDKFKLASRGFLNSIKK